MAKIGIVPMSAKPLHAGHYGLILLAAKENDVVHLYVSLSDRDEVSGKAMEKIWKEIIEPTLPENVIVTYGGSPVGNAWKDVGDANLAGSTDTYKIYSDPVDAEANFPDSLMQKYAPDLFKNGQLTTRPVERASTVDVSGTKMRQFLKNNDEASFLRFMPRQIDGQRVWNILKSMAPLPKKKKSVAEVLLRAYIRTLLS